MLTHAAHEVPYTSPTLAEEELRARYAAYRRRHAARMLQMVPRDAIRPLYRRARLEAVGAGGGPAPEADDPLALLVGYCGRLLPLPPFDVWREDFARNPDAHFADLEDSLDGPTPEAPSTMEVRDLDIGGRPWTAHLRAFQEGGFWRAFISFEEGGTGRLHRTASVFYERDAAELRDRFLSFEPEALRAFLRSALP
jgi:hypothetical protein